MWIVVIVFYACPQLINDVDSKLFGVSDLESPAIEEESSLDYTDSIKNEGKIDLHLSIVEMGDRYYFYRYRYWYCIFSPTDTNTDTNTKLNKIAGLFNIRPKLLLWLNRYYLDHSQRNLNVI